MLTPVPRYLSTLGGPVRRLEQGKAGAKELTELETCAQELGNLHKGPQLGTGF